jgi:hypothetical protein
VIKESSPRRALPGRGGFLDHGKVVVALLALLTVGGCSGSGSSGSPSSSRTTRPSVSRTGASGATSPSPSFAGIGSPSRGLDEYTDLGDGCPQAISAIGYADESLLPLGQEPYQKFDDLVRSKLAAVAGTLALEQKDWPDPSVHKQSLVVQKLADEAGRLIPEGDPAARTARIQTLLTYRIEAGRLILACRAAAAAR